MNIPRNHCRDSVRCVGCPIEALTDPRDRVMAADITAGATRLLTYEVRATPNQVTMGMLAEVVSQIVDTVNRRDLAGPAVGALAITLGSFCKPE